MADPYIAQLLAALERETNSHNISQAQAWQKMESVFVAFADAIDRHTAALTEAWPPSKNAAAAAFLGHVQALRAPLNAAALEAAGTNAAALRAIADSATQAHRSMQQEYETSKTITARWAAITPTANTGQEDATLAEQTANRQRAARILDRYKTDIAQATFQTPPNYVPPRVPYPVETSWAGKDASGDTAATSPSPGDNSKGANPSLATTPLNDASRPKLAGSLAAELTGPIPAPIPTADIAFPAFSRHSPPIYPLPNAAGMARPHSRGTTAPSLSRQVPPGTSTGNGGAAPPVVGGRFGTHTIETGGHPLPRGAAPSVVGGQHPGGAIGRTSDHSGQGIARGQGNVHTTSAAGNSPTSTGRASQSGRGGPVADEDDHEQHYEIERVWTLPKAGPSVIAAPVTKFVIDPGPAIGQ
jgi:hypothetical protein